MKSELQNLIEKTGIEPASIESDHIKELIIIFPELIAQLIRYVPPKTYAEVIDLFFKERIIAIKEKLKESPLQKYNCKYSVLFYLLLGFGFLQAIKLAMEETEKMKVVIYGENLKIDIRNELIETEWSSSIASRKKRF